MKKGHHKFDTLSPHSIPFLSVLHQNEALYDFRKRGQHLTVERNISVEYALPESLFDSILQVNLNKLSLNFRTPWTGVVFQAQEWKIRSQQSVILYN